MREAMKERLKTLMLELREEKDPEKALEAVAILNHKLQDLIEDLGLTKIDHPEGGRAVSLLCDYILVVDAWHPASGEDDKGE